MATNQEHQETPEYSNFQAHYCAMMYAIQDPLPLAARLFSLGIIEHAVLQQVSITPALTSLEKSVILLSAIEGQIRTKPSTFHVFLEALREEPSLQYLAESMEGRLSIKRTETDHGEDWKIILSCLHDNLTYLGRSSSVPRSLPRFYLAAVEKKIFLHGCEIKSGRRPGNEARKKRVYIYMMTSVHWLDMLYIHFITVIHM